MSKLLQAMVCERTYLKYRMRDEEPFHLVDKIQELGYSSLEEYFSEKMVYEFGKIVFEYIEKQPAECIAEVLRMINEKVIGVLFVDTDSSFIFQGAGCDFNEDYCAENNIPVYPIYTKGGCIVSSAGDFSFGICLPSDCGIDRRYILENVRTILSKYSDSVIVSGNDILIDNKKVLGSATYMQNGMFMFVAHVSFVDSSDVITNVCTKTSGKDVGYICDVTRDAFKQEVKTWLLRQ